MQRLHNIFTEQFSAVSFKPSGEKTLPAIFTTNLRSLLQQLESLHRRQINIVRISADMGKQFLKVAISPSFYPSDHDDKVAEDDPADHSRRRTTVKSHL